LARIAPVDVAMATIEQKQTVSHCVVLGKKIVKIKHTLHCCR